MKNGNFHLDEYPFAIQPLSDEDGGGYVIEFPDVPGCFSDGETPEEAIVNGRDALKTCLLTMKEFGDPIPKPGALARSSGQWRRVPKSLHALLVARAEQEGVSLNTLVTSLLSEGVGRGGAGTAQRRDRARPGNEQRNRSLRTRAPSPHPHK